jgi:hypothetical protein
MTLQETYYDPVTGLTPVDVAGIHRGWAAFSFLGIPAGIRRQDTVGLFWVYPERTSSLLVQKICLTT